MAAVSHMDPKPQAGHVVHGDLAAFDALGMADIGVFCWADERPLAGPAGYLDWRLCGALSRTLERGVFEGRRSEIMLLAARGRTALKRVFVFGLGPSEEASATAMRHVCRQAYETMYHAGVATFTFAAPTQRRRPDLESLFLRAATEELPGRIDVVLVEYAA